MSAGPSNSDDRQFPPADDLKRFEQECDDFANKHREWLIQLRVSPDDPFYCLSPRHLDVSLRLYRLSDEEEVAEREFSAMCDRNRAIGLLAGRPIDFKWLREPLPTPAVENMELFLDLGWDQSHIDAIVQSAPQMSSLFQRMRAAAGRLLSSHDFEKDRDQLRTMWQELADDDRPSLPAFPTVALKQLPQAPADGPAMPSKAVPQEFLAASEPIAQFGRALTDFCNRWHLQGLATWDLPIPDGPKWSTLATPPELSEQGISVTHTPFHFPLQASDDLGKVAEDNHHRASSRRGVDDHAMWETYAHFLPLAHWQAVFTSRYSKPKRSKGFMLQMEAVIAAIIEVSDERVKRLRRHYKALKSGRKTSLRGLR